MSFISRSAALVIGATLSMLVSGCGAGDAESAVTDRPAGSTAQDDGVADLDASPDSTLPTMSVTNGSLPVVDPDASTTVPSDGPNRDAAAIRSSTTQVTVPPRRSASTPPPLATTPGGRPDQSAGPAPSVPGGPAAAAARSRLDQALADQDLCEVYAALGELEVSGKSVREFRSGMVIVLGAVRRASAFAPDDLTDSWRVLVADTERVVEVLGAPDASVSSAAAVFQDQAYRDAMDRTDAWMDANCGR